MDALTDVLRAMRLSGGVFLDAECTESWRIIAKVSPEDCGPFIAEPAQLIAYHYVALHLERALHAPHRCAAERLRHGQQSVAEIGYEVGYESEAAFNRAFKREFGTAPGAFRKESLES
jgi:Helix-turn-helix domain